MRLTLRVVVTSASFWIIAAGYLLRIMMMPITGQHDVMFMPWMAHFITQGNFNLYAYLYQTFGPIVMERPGIWAPYPYGFYLFTASWLALLEKIGLVDLAAWNSIWEVSHPARYVFLFKAAYLPFDIAIAYLLYRTGGRVGLALWTWSPAAIYTPFMMGQNDVYATALVVAGTYAAARAVQAVPEAPASSGGVGSRWAILACVFLGVGSTFKIYPLLLLLPLVLVIENRLWPRLGLFALGGLIFGAAVLPFLSTQAFVEGVLLNPEGTSLFREIPLFGVSVSPFLVGYVILTGTLALYPVQRTPGTVWLAGLAVMALVFLWTPTPFYWLIWITPLLIGTIRSFPTLMPAWFLAQLAFALMVVNQHRELGVALPIHLSPISNVPNLPTALTLLYPLLQRAYGLFLPIINVFLITALLLALWVAARALARPQQTHPSSLALRPLGWVGIIFPAAILMLSLSANLFIARNLVSRTIWSGWQNQVVAAGEQVVQRLALENREVTGVRLRFVDADPQANLEVCLYRNQDLDQEPLACATRSTAAQVENRILYFTFGRVLALEAGDLLTLRVQTADNGAGTVTLPYTTSADLALAFGATKLTGSLDVSLLSAFTITQAFQELVVKNIGRDGWLLAAIAAVTGLTVLVLGVLLRSPNREH